MIIQIDHKDFLMAMLDGAWFGSKPVPLDVGNALKAQDPNEEIFVLNRPSESAQFFELWTKEGWANEQQRLIYIATIREAPTVVTPKPKELPTKKGDIVSAIIQATQQGLWDEVKQLQQKLVELKQNENS